MMTRLKSFVSPVSLLLLGLLTGPSWTNTIPFVDAAKRLVLFAGPHRAGAASVEEFFDKYCYGWVKNDHLSFALRFWRWPDVKNLPNDDGRVPSYKIFQHLVLNDGVKDGLTIDIMDAIKTAWEVTTDGIILGTEYFDQMGPYAQHDGLAAMQRIVDGLGVAPEDVTVVVNYRAPRFDHWESIWRGSVQGTDRSYGDFLCTRTGYHEKMELLDTAMNPLQIAKKSREQGWRVALMDMAAIEEAKTDVAHSIACNVLQAKCDGDGWVNNHEQESIRNNPAEEGHDITELKGSDKWLAERLLQARDCAYRPVLENDPFFAVIPQGDNSIWTDAYCDPDKDGTTYQGLLDVGLVFRGLLSQMHCADKPAFDDMPHSINDILDGKFSLESSPAPPKSPETDTPPAETPPKSPETYTPPAETPPKSPETYTPPAETPVPPPPVSSPVSISSGSTEGTSLGSVHTESSISGDSTSSDGGGGGSKFLWFLLLTGGIAFYVHRDMNAPHGGRVVPTLRRLVNSMQQTTSHSHHQYQQPTNTYSDSHRVGAPDSEIEPIEMVASTKLSDMI